MSWSGGDVIWSSESNLTKKWLHEKRETSSPLNIYSFIKYGVHIDSDLKVIVAYLNDQKVVTHDHFILFFFSTYYFLRYLLICVIITSRTGLTKSYTRIVDNAPV